MFNMGMAPGFGHPGFPGPGFPGPGFPLGEFRMPVGGGVGGYKFKCSKK